MTAARLPLIDLLKAVASQAIVLHHLAFYGPMAQTIRPYATGFVDTLAEHARFAVQVFFVIGGFLAARSLAPDGVARPNAPVALAAARWLRLAGPYVAAIALAVATAAIGRALATHPTIPDAPTVLQVLANLAMLQDIAGEPALSAGLWYVAIDLQLYVVALVVLGLAARIGHRLAAPVAIVALAALSLLHFNRDPRWDAWAVYFLGAYGLGMLAAWVPPSAIGRRAIVAIAVLGALALALDFRGRIAVALATALLLAWTLSRGTDGRAFAPPRIAWLARISYSVFLVHFPVLVLVEAAAARWFADDPLACAIALAAAFVASTGAGAVLHRWVEVPSTRAATRLLAGRARAVTIAVPAAGRDAPPPAAGRRR